MDALAKQHVPEASVIQAVGKDVVISLPNRDDINSITQLIAALEHDKQVFGIDSFGISDTPLEDVSIDYRKAGGKSTFRKPNSLLLN